VQQVLKSDDKLSISLFGLSSGVAVTAAAGTGTASAGRKSEEERK